MLNVRFWEKKPRKPGPKKKTWAAKTYANGKRSVLSVLDSLAAAVYSAYGWVYSLIERRLDKILVKKAAKAEALQKAAQRQAVLDAFIDLNQKCPACGHVPHGCVCGIEHGDSKLAYVPKLKQIVHQCPVCAAAAAEAPIFKPKGWDLASAEDEEQKRTETEIDRRFNAGQMNTQSRPLPKVKAQVN